MAPAPLSVYNLVHEPREYQKADQPAEVRGLTVLVDILLTLSVFFGMWVVGLGLTAEDFRRLASLRLGMALGLVAPIVLLPLLASGIARWLAVPPAVAGGLIVLSAAPPAAISNLYVAMARANTALCVTLTAASTLVAVVTMPLAMLLGFRGLAIAGAGLRVPVLATTGQLVLLLIVPAGLGMAVRAWRPETAVKHLGGLRLLSLMTVLVPLFVVVWLQWGPFLALAGQAALAAVLFTVVSAALGYSLGVLASPLRPDRFALAVNVSTRSFGLAATVGATFMGRTDFLAFVAVFFLTNAALASAAILFSRAFGQPEPPPKPPPGKG